MTPESTLSPRIFMFSSWLLNRIMQLIIIETKNNRKTKFQKKIANIKMETNNLMKTAKRTLHVIK